MSLPRLSDPLAALALAHLGVPRGEPTLPRLNRLIRAHVRTVPWDTVLRIIRRNNLNDPALCPRLPAEFWSDVLACGGGGTCFENNYAFAALLGTLGYQGYLTINDLGGNPRNHCATTVEIAGKRYLVDVTLPIDVALPLNSQATSRRSTPFHTFTVRPLGRGRYQVERTRHPKREAYVLHDRPVRLDAYERAIAADYGPAGLFLDRVIIVKIIGNTFWRFSSSDRPLRIEGFERAGTHTITLSPRTAAARLARHFRMSKSKIVEGLRALENRARMEINA